MKVVFLDDVPKVAKAGEVKEVPAGYARNFLIPRKLALAASPEAVNSVAQEVQKRARWQARSETELIEMANQLDGKEITISAKAGAKERLYGSITTADIAREIEKTTKLSVDKRKIELDEPIHRLGSYEIAIRLGKEIAPKIKLVVTREPD